MTRRRMYSAGLMRRSAALHLRSAYCSVVRATCVRMTLCLDIIPPFPIPPFPASRPSC